MNEPAEAVCAAGQRLISGPALLGLRSRLCHNRRPPDQPLCRFSVRVHVASFLGCSEACARKHAAPTARTMCVSLIAIATVKGGGSQRGAGPSSLPSVTARRKVSTLR